MLTFVPKLLLAAEPYTLKSRGLAHERRGRARLKILTCTKTSNLHKQDLSQEGEPPPTR